MPNKRKKRCPHCGFLETIKWGKRNGHTRYYCKNCRSYFTDQRSAVSAKNKFVWFDRWIRGKQSIRSLAIASGYSERSLKRYFYELLPRCPVWQIQRREKVNLLIDGTYFSNKVCLIVYRDHTVKMTILYRISKGEALRDLMEDLKAIRGIGIQIQSVTCDGAPNILKAVREVCPEAILQRCTVHVAREVETWITRKPQSEAAQDLLALVRLLNGVQTHEEAQLWMRAFIDWYHKYETFINEKSVDEESGKWWFTHKMLHRSATHIKRAIPDLFSFTRHPNLPKSSNSIEAFFGHLKDNLRIHRGLSEQHFKDFIKWYLFLCSNNAKISKKEGPE